MELRDLLEKHDFYLYYNARGFALTDKSISRIMKHHSTTLSDIIPFHMEPLVDVNFKFGSGIDYYSHTDDDDVHWNSRRFDFYEFADWIQDGIAALPSKI